MHICEKNYYANANKAKLHKQKQIYNALCIFKNTAWKLYSGFPLNWENGETWEFGMGGREAGWQK